MPTSLAEQVETSTLYKRDEYEIERPGRPHVSHTITPRRTWGQRLVVAHGGCNEWALKGRTVGDEAVREARSRVVVPVLANARKK